MLLKGEDVLLRPLEPYDSEIIYQWENNSDFWKISDNRIPFSKYTIEQYVNSIQDIYINNQLRFLICNLPDKEPIGAIDLFEFDPQHQRAGVGILIAKGENRKKGLASEALKLLVEYSFSVLLLNQLFCNVSVENEDSLKLFLASDFKIIGLKKEWIRTKDGFVDEYMLQLLNSYSN